MKSKIKSFGIAICLIAIMAIFPSCGDPAPSGGTLIIINPATSPDSRPIVNSR